MADARANRFGLWRGLNKRCRVTDIFQASCSERCRIRPLCCRRNKPTFVIEKTVLRIWVESSPNPRSEMPQFEQAGFLTYSRIKNLPDLVMDLRQWYESFFWYAFWKLQQRDCPGFPPDSLFIRNAGRQTGHLLRDKDSVFVWAGQSFSFLFAEFQYACFGCNNVHPVGDKNQGLIAIMVTDILP